MSWYAYKKQKDDTSFNPFSFFLLYKGGRVLVLFIQMYVKCVKHISRISMTDRFTSLCVGGDDLALPHPPRFPSRSRPSALPFQSPKKVPRLRRHPAPLFRLYGKHNRWRPGEGLDKAAIKRRLDGSRGRVKIVALGDLVANLRADNHHLARTLPPGPWRNCWPSEARRCSRRWSVTRRQWRRH